MSVETILFDAPGPRARRRNAAIAPLGGLLALGLMAWVLKKLADKGNLTADKWSPFLRADTWTEYLVQGLVGTLKAATITAVIFITINYLLTVFAGRIEGRLRRRGHTSGTTPAVPGEVPVVGIPAGA
jgi:glutamate transport system permease protein